MESDMKNKILQISIALLLTGYSSWLYSTDEIQATIEQTSAIKVSWDPVTQDTMNQTEQGVIYYNVFSDTVPTFVPDSTNFLGATTDTFLVHDGSAQTDHFYTIRATDEWGNHSGFSDITGTSLYVLAKIKIFLEGAHVASADTMKTILRLNNHIPQNSPYEQDPRYIQVLPDSVVDWVLVELCSAPDGEPLAHRSFFLRKDGQIMPMDNRSNELGITGVSDGDYHIIIKHRNHLAAMSRSTVSLFSSASTLYDFTSDSTQYYGSNSSKEVKTGIWALWSGDIDANNKIDSNDYKAWLNAASNKATGYQNGDINMDGQTTTDDYTIWYRNQRQNLSTDVP
jgi:hypothetical protein